MYTATITNKTLTNGFLQVSVQFTDGVNTISENFKPVDVENLRYLVRSKLRVLDNAGALDAAVQVGDTLTGLETDQTQAELNAEAWLTLYRKWVTVKKNLIDAQIITGNETNVTQLKTKVQNDFLPAYIDLL